MKEKLLELLNKKIYKYEYVCIFKLACRKGYNDIVKYILDNNLIYSSNNIVNCAFINGHIEVVKLLLTDDRVDPSDDNNYVIRHVSLHGYLEIVKLLLSDYRVDPSDDNNYSIVLANINSHLEVIRILLADSRVDPSDDENDAIRWSCINGQLEIVKLLLKDDRVDPSDKYNYAIKWAIEKENVEIVKLLLTDHRTNLIGIDNNNNKLNKIICDSSKVYNNYYGTRNIKKNKSKSFIRSCN